jgi:rhodanese-related sulfurtransferase
MKFKLFSILVISFWHIGCQNIDHSNNVDLSSVLDNNTYLTFSDWEDLKNTNNQELTIIDTRSEEAYNANHLDDAVQMSPLDLLDTYANNEGNSETQPIVIYSDSVERIHGTYLALKSTTKRPVYLLLANFQDGLEFDSLYAEGIDPAIMEYSTKWEELLKNAKLEAPEPIAAAPPKKKIVPKKKVVKEEEEEGC